MLLLPEMRAVCARQALFIFWLLNSKFCYCKTYNYVGICRTVYDAVAESLAGDRPLRGAMFWEWNPDGEPRGNRAIQIGDTAWK